MARVKSTDGEAKAVKSSEASQKLQAIKVAMEQIDKQYGTGSIMRLGEKASATSKTDIIPTGCIALDLALGVGGVPRGRVVEVFGPEASGKTTLTLHIIVDAEHALDPSRAEAIGVNIDDLLVSQPDTGEQALEIVETLVRSGAIDVVVV